MSTFSYLAQSARVVALLTCLTALASPLAAQLPQTKAKQASPAVVVRAPQEFLTTPRETLKSFYYAAVAYDFRPQLLAEAVACLDLEASRAGDAAEAARLVVELEQTLRILCVPINGVPERVGGETVPLLDGEGFKVTLARGSDGLWRFDRETVVRIPGMYRSALARFRGTQGERAQFSDDFSDPATTLRRFQLEGLFQGDFYSAARCLDLSSLDNETRTEQGPLLAKKLAFVMQRRSWVYQQEVPNQSNGPPYTWHADATGRIVLERVRQSDGKEAWLFSRRTVRNIAAMYEQVKDRPADPRYVRLGRELKPLTDADDPARSKRRPDEVPTHLGSPRALLQGFFRTMDAAEAKDAKLLEALNYLDLGGLPQSDRQTQGTKLAIKLEAVLRKIRIELSALPDDWNAPTQLLGEPQGVRIEIVRQRDGCWRFSQATVGQATAFFDKLAAKDTSNRERATHLDSPRDAMSTFLTATRRGELERAAECLDLSHLRTGAQDEIGPLLAFKLRHVIDRTGRVYIQEVPDTPDGPRYVFYRGELGRIVIARKTEGAQKGSWLFTPETIGAIEPMFLGLLDQPIVETGPDHPHVVASFWATPGIWVRERVREPLKVSFWRLQIYQWIGLAVALALSVLASLVVLAQVHRIVAFILRQSGSVLTKEFVAAKLRPLTWVNAWWLLFQMLTLLDLPIRFVDALLPFKTFGMAGLIAWFGVQFVDLITGIYMNSELLRPHRSLSDMIVPVSMRALKGMILLAVAIYVIYQFGEGDSLSRFLTGLGVLGLAASLAAQDALKSFFSTLLLIGERSFKIGDKITVGNLEGVVEVVGFRATRMRTADGSLLTVPNSTIASAAIDNQSTKSFTRCKLSLLINYDTTPERVLALRDAIRTWLAEQSYLRAEKSEVTVNRLTEKGVEVLLDLQLTQVGGAVEKQVKEEINCAVLRLCEEATEQQTVGYHHPLLGSETALTAGLVKRGAA